MSEQREPQLAEFDPQALAYELPQDRIAQVPVEPRDAARLLCMERSDSGPVRHAHVRDLPRLLRPSLLVLNDTRVLPARLRTHKPTGGKQELLLIERVSAPGASERWLALGRNVRAGDVLTFDAGRLRARIGARNAAAYEVELEAQDGPIEQALARAGEVPLPPYIRRAPDARDAERYQTVYAAHAGAVAAPTAGLHLTDALLSELQACGHELAFVTLHVGPGTFAPLAPGVELGQHRMHSERYHIPDATVAAVARARREGRAVLAVGTTSVRALEAAADTDGVIQSGTGSTALFIRPPYRFRVVDALMTNFHLPRSTLLALCMAFGGVAPLQAAYRAAIAHGYRFYSYGDAMLIGAAS